jgi:hypothetical protein
MLVERLCTPLPPGSHLVIWEAGRSRRGVDVVALIPPRIGRKVEVITCRGDTVSLGESSLKDDYETELKIGTGN